jgi:hypothetical protein
MNGTRHGLHDAASVKRHAEFQMILINDHARRNTSEAARKSRWTTAFGLPNLTRCKLAGFFLTSCKGTCDADINEG